MDQIVSDYETRGAKTTATLKLQKAKELQAAAQVSLDQLRSRRGAMKDTDINVSAVDAQIVVAATKLATTIQNVAMVQSDCDKIGCDAASVSGKLVVANNLATQKQSDSNVLADQNDSLPVWAYVLIALALLGIVLGIAWFFTRSSSTPSPPTVLPSVLLQPIAPTNDISTLSKPIEVATPVTPLTSSVPATLTLFAPTLPVTTLSKPTEVATSITPLTLSVPTPTTALNLSAPTLPVTTLSAPSPDTSILSAPTSSAPTLIESIYPANISVKTPPLQSSTIVSPQSPTISQPVPVVAKPKE